MRLTGWKEKRRKNGLGEYERREIGLRKEKQVRIKNGQHEKNSE